MNKTTSPILRITLAGVLALLVSSARADTFGSGGNSFTIDFVPIGNAGNAADTTGYGAVPYNYNMGTYAISQDQITKATASGLTSVTAGAWSGSQPAAYMTWYEAAAFVNWLNTSTGHPLAYNLNAGATALTLWQPTEAGYDASNLYRNSNAYYFLPSENEYYKSAYYDPNKDGGAGYWLYATGSDTAPTAVASGTAAGTAVYNQPYEQGPAAVNSAGGLSPYGTMGQNGNVFEWQESAHDGVNNVPSEDRTLRGGPWAYPEVYMSSPVRISDFPQDNVEPSYGFRVASVVPEPSSAVLMLGSGAMLLLRRRRASAL